MHIDKQFVKEYQVKNLRESNNSEAYIVPL